MLAEKVSTLPFPGWEQFCVALYEIDPEVGLRSIQLLVQALADQQDGVFRGASPIVPETLHVVLREWIAKLSSNAMVPNLDTAAKITAISVVVKGSRQINYLRDHHSALVAPLVLPENRKLERELLKYWFFHLEQVGKTWAPKYEFGRTQRMFGEIWESLLESEEITVKAQHTSSFLNTPLRLLLSIGVWSNAGWIDDARVLLSQSSLSDEVISTLLEICCIRLEQVQFQLQNGPKYPENVRNTFHRYPLIRIGTWGVFAPLPDVTLQWWDMQNLFEGLECTVNSSVYKKGANEYYGALGIVMEHYVHELLQEIERGSGAVKFIPPFEFNPNHESPDGFLHNPQVGTIVIESKCYRIPQSAYEDITLDSFMAWFGNLLGTNSKGRLPLHQGHAFFDEWTVQNPRIMSHLDGSDPGRSIYVIVSYEDIPIFVQWANFRKWYLDYLDYKVFGLWEKTLVISMRELEILASAAQVAGLVDGPPTPFSPFDILKEYLSYRNSEADVGVTGEAVRLKSALGNWLIEKWPAARSAFPTTISDAYARLFENVASSGFGGPAA